MNKLILILLASASLVQVFVPASVACASTATMTQPVSVVSPYIDPTAGGALIQLLLAGGVGLVSLVALFWRRISSRFWLFRRRSQSGATDQDNDEGGKRP
jgi:hypothetical protein